MTPDPSPGPTWWTEADAEAFTARAKALVDQYNVFTVLDGLYVNGQLTLGENIGDLTGVYIGYLAYKNSLGGKEPPVIDGLTGDQRFFIGYAQIWRAKERDETLRRRIMTNPHSPSEFRTNGPLRNFAPFLQAFDVHEGDGMVAAARRTRIDLVMRRRGRGRSGGRLNIALDASVSGLTARAGSRSSASPPGLPPA